MRALRTLNWTLLTPLFLLACSDSTGEEGEPCYENMTCDAGLTCLSNLCVSDGQTGTGGNPMASGGDDGTGGDAETGGDQATGGTTDTGGETGSGGSESSGGSSSGGTSSGGNASGGKANGGMGGQPLGPDVIFQGDTAYLDASDYGIHGSFFILEDSVKDGVLVEEDPNLTYTDLYSLESSTEPSDFSDSTMPCISGTVAVVTDPEGEDCELFADYCDWETFWGGGIAANLNQEDEEDPEAWDATAQGVTGFAFETSGSIGGVPLRFTVEDVSGNQFCKQGLAPGSYSLAFSDLTHDCWAPGSKQLDPSKIVAISWTFVPDASDSYPISNFCVDGLSVLR